MGFWKLLCSIWASKNNCCGCRWTFPWNVQEIFQETLLIPVHEFARGNNKAIINEGFYRYLNKVQMINSAEKVILHQCLQGVLFALYAWNLGPVHGTDIAQSVVDIVRAFKFTFYISPEMLREANTEVQQALDHFETASPHLFRQI